MNAHHPDHPTPEDRLGELVERRARGELTETDRIELDRLASEDPGVLELVQRAHEEVAAMQAVSTEIVAGFDFERARRAIAERDRLYRRVLVQMSIMLAMIAGFWVFLARATGWEILAWSVGLPAAPVLLWIFWRGAQIRRERRLLLARGEEVMQEIFEANRRSVRNEFEIVRACLVLASIGMLVLAADAVVTGSYAKLVVAGVVLLAVLATAAPRLFGARAKSRIERFASGDLSADDFAKGKDREDR